MCAQFDKEVAACELALQVLSEGEFAGISLKIKYKKGYIGDRMQ